MFSWCQGQLFPLSLQTRLGRVERKEITAPTPTTALLSGRTAYSNHLGWQALTSEHLIQEFRDPFIKTPRSTRSSSTTINCRDIWHFSWTGQDKGRHPHFIQSIYPVIHVVLSGQTRTIFRGPRTLSLHPDPRPDRTSTITEPRAMVAGRSHW